MRPDNPQPWPRPIFADPAGISNVAISQTGGVRWSVVLPDRMLSSIVTARGGRWVVLAERGLMMGDASGVRWALEQGGLKEVLPDGTLVVSEANSVVLRDLDTGAERRRYEGGGLAVRSLPDGALAFSVPEDRGGRLVVVDAAGNVRGSQPVSDGLAGLIVHDNMIVSCGKAVMEGFDFGGNPLWRASLDGFGVMASASNHRFNTPAMSLDDERIIVGGATEKWDAFMLVNPRAQTVEPLRMPNGTTVMSSDPFVIRRVPHLPLALVTGFHSTLDVLALDVSESWQAPFYSEPRAFAVDPEGRIAVVHSLSTDYHDAYAWHNEGSAVRGRSGVSVFGANKQLLWNWEAPGPVQGLAIGSEGEVLVTSEGRLWALG